MNLAAAFAYNLRKVQELEKKELPLELLLKREGDKVTLSIVFVERVIGCEALTACITVWCPDAETTIDYIGKIDRVYQSIELAARMPVNKVGLLDTINFN